MTASPGYIRYQHISMHATGAFQITGMERALVSLSGTMRLRPGIAVAGLLTVHIPDRIRPWPKSS